MRLRSPLTPLALVLITVLTANSAPALAADTDVLLTATVSDSELTLTATGDVVTVPHQGIVTGTVSISSELPAGTTASPVDIALRGAEGPGEAVIRLAGVELATVGDSTTVDPAAGGILEAAFSLPGHYRLTFDATASIALPPPGQADAEDAAGIPATVGLASSVAVLEFVVEAPPPPDQGVTEQTPESDDTGEVGESVANRAFATPGISTETRPIALTRGHIDLFEVVYDDGVGGLRLNTKDDTNLYQSGARYRAPGEVTVFVDSDLSALDVSGMPPAFEFLTVDGDTVYLLPQTQDFALPWPGWSTERLASSLPAGIELPSTGNPVRLAVDVEGPGNVFTWQAGAFGGVQNKYVDTVDPAPDAIPIARSAHVHTNWVFTVPGDYYLTVTPTATTTTGTTLTGPGVVYRIHVGPAAAAAPVASIAPAITGSGEIGEVLTLDSGQWLPIPHRVELQWLRDGEPIEGADGDEYTVVDADAGHTVSARVTASVGDASTEVDTLPVEVEGNPDDSGRWDVPNGTSTDSGATILNLGHVDIASVLEDGELVTRITDTTESSTPVWRMPEDTVLQAVPGAAVEVPEFAEYGFLGAPGDTVWLLPQIQDETLLWPGWSTEHIPVDASRSDFDWVLTDLEGPGEFALFEENAVGLPTVFFNSGDGLPDTMSIPRHVHAHGSWAFGAEGVYCLEFSRSTTLAGGDPVSDDFVLTMAVGNVDVTSVDPGECFAPGFEPPKPDNPGQPNPSPRPSAPQSQCVAGATILSAGHIDYSTRIVGGKLESLIGDDTGGSKVYREPSGVVLWLKPSSAVILPPTVPQIGPAGSKVWQVPQTQNPNLIWLGWSTEALNAGNTSSPVTWTLNSVSGPGTVKVYTTGSFGGVSMVLNGPGSYTIPLGVHAHANWAFSAEGVYRLSFTQRATLANGSSSADTETLTIVVGDVDPASAARGSGCGAISNALLASGSSDGAKTAAEQAAAAGARVTGEARLFDGSRATDPITELNQGNPVPLLLWVLGGLLLAGAAGSGVLWWRSSKAS